MSSDLPHSDPHAPGADRQHAPGADPVAEPDHQPPAPADRLDQGQQLPVEVHHHLDHQESDRSTPQVAEPDQLQAAASTAARGLATCIGMKLQPGSLACLLALLAGADNCTGIRQLTGLPITTVRTAVRRLTGKPRYAKSKRRHFIRGTGIALISERPHPHPNANGERQLRLTTQGRRIALILLGDAGALAAALGAAAGCD